MSALFIAFIIGAAAGGVFVVLGMLAYEQWVKMKANQIPEDWRGIHEDR